ncbi:UBX domain-containing protein 4 [Haematobia irritans]|uniref:UBX domain-containing protein 4 n=1 Tax=Haematobia irritans TaxID=7368 RepID=UPI003F4F7391
MNWYKGNIAEAVAKSKSMNAIFVVFVEGNDENTAKLTKFIDDAKVSGKLCSNDFVAIKVKSDSEAYMQFASIYQMVPVPSLFFIGKSGTPLDICTSVIANVDELEMKVAKVLELAGKKQPTSGSNSSQEFISQEAKASTSQASPTKKEAPIEQKKVEVKENVVETNNAGHEDIVCDGDVCVKKPKETSTPLAPLKQEEKEKKLQENDQNLTEKEKEDKMAETRKILEQKRRERVEEEKRLEKERELQRRKLGKDMQNLRAWQKDQELKELKDSIKKDRLEEQAARERILAQIAADKAERAHKFGTGTNDNQASTSQAAGQASSTLQTNPTPAATDETRLQFRFASGDSRTKNFKCSTTLSDIRDYVKNDLLPGTGIKDFTLATTYPKREFTTEHYSKTLTELELIPSAVILIIGKEATGPSAMIARQGGIFNILSMVVMSILNPIFSLFTTAKNWVTGKGAANNAQTGAQKRANEERGVQDDVAKRRNLDRFVGGGNAVSDNSNNGPNSSPGTSSQAYRRYVSGSNVHRLADNRKDSDDENATWNGNSTQQQ